MKAKRFPLLYVAVALLMLTILALFPYLLEASYLSGFSPGFNIRNIVKHTDLIVRGTVSEKEFVFRADAACQYTTDVTVNVTDRIKGVPNLGLLKVKFMIYGGEGIHPETGRDLIVKSTDTPNFEIGEQVLLFLSKSKRENQNIPHGGYYVFYGDLGKMKIVNGKVSIPYSFKKTIVNSRNGQLTNKKIDIRQHIELPINLVSNLSKASLVDYNAVTPLEARIRLTMSNTRRGIQPQLTEEVVNELNQSAIQILERDLEKDKD